MTSWCRTLLTLIQFLRWPGWQEEAGYPPAAGRDRLSGKGDYVNPDANRALAPASRLRSDGGG